MDLAQQVRQYYLDHFELLPFDKQFHFVSRLASWHDDAECISLLQNLKDSLLPPQATAREILQDVLTNLPDVPINAAQERAPYFAKYPKLRGRMLALFRVRHLLSLYNTDVRGELTDIVPLDQLRSLAADLRQNDDAVRILSTYAVNYIYLVDHILFPLENASTDSERFYELGDAYDLSNQHDVLLLIYLYTHCIIGESNFYKQPVGSGRRETCLKMLTRLENIIRQYFDGINLDNKLEFLVCCRILGYKTGLFERIYAECTQSVSAEGTFLIDTINRAGQADKTSFVHSEHRNVLFIMSTTDYHAS